MDRQFSCSSTDESCEGIGPDTDLLCSFKKKIIKHTIRCTHARWRTSSVRVVELTEQHRALRAAPSSTKQHWVSMRYVVCAREFDRGPLSSHTSLEHLPPPRAAAIRAVRKAEGRSTQPARCPRWAKRTEPDVKENSFLGLATSSAALTGWGMRRDACGYSKAIPNRVSLF